MGLFMPAFLQHIGDLTIVDSGSVQPAETLALSTLRESPYRNLPPEIDAVAS